jgi:hypothetical protein
VSRYTALYVDADRMTSGAATRIVPLQRLLSQRSWPPASVLSGRLCQDASDATLVEGIFARIVEAVDQSGDLPDRDGDGFLMGMEFSTLAEEQAFFARHGLRLEAAEEEVVLSGGDLLIFDNLTTAHGRRGRREPGELHQLCIGFGSLEVDGQAVLLDRILSCFTCPQGAKGATVPAQSPGGD